MRAPRSSPGPDGVKFDFERGLLLLPDSKTGRKTIVLNAPGDKGAG